MLICWFAYATLSNTSRPFPLYIVPRGLLKNAFVLISPRSHVSSLDNTDISWHDVELWYIQSNSIQYEWCYVQSNSIRSECTIFNPILPNLNDIVFNLIRSNIIKFQWTRLQECILSIKAGSISTKTHIFSSWNIFLSAGQIKKASSLIIKSAPKYLDNVHKYLFHTFKLTTN